MSQKIVQRIKKIVQMGQQIFTVITKNSGIGSRLLNSSYDFKYLNEYETQQCKQTHFT